MALFVFITALVICIYAASNMSTHYKNVDSYRNDANMAIIALVIGVPLLFILASA